MKLELETYTASEAEQITQLPQTTVRNWRRAGYLTRSPGHARYSLADLLVLSAMQSLVSRGVMPETARGYAGEIARAVFQSAILRAEAYSQNIQHKAAELAAQEVTSARIRQLEAATGAPVSEDEVTAHEARRHMMDAAERSFGLTGLKAPEWLIIWANGELEFDYEGEGFAERFFGNTALNEWVQGPVMLFYLPAMAQMIFDRLPRPAIKLAGEG